MISKRSQINNYIIKYANGIKIYQAFYLINPSTIKSYDSLSDLGLCAYKAIPLIKNTAPSNEIALMQPIN